MPRTPGFLATLAVLTCLSGCAPLQASGPGKAERAAATVPAPPPPVLQPYFDTLAAMAPGDPARQQAALASALAAAERTRNSADTLRYALALGSAGHASSNPVEAKRLITELLAGPNTLDPLETALANAYLREFDARVGLYAELARQPEDAEQKLRSLDATADRREDSLVAENRQLRKALAEAERKLEAVAEMERALNDQAGEEAAEPAPPRPRQ